MTSQVLREVRTAEKRDTERTHEIKTAEKADIEDVIDTLVLAFASDPVARWLYPNPRDYMEYFPEVVKKYASKAFERDTAYYVQDFSGVALWLPPNVHPDEEGLAEVLQDSLPEKRLETALAGFGQLDDYHPDEPHWHLAFLGVEPTKQRNGLGSALLERGLATCDEEGVPVYLESAKTENVSLYLRHGFEVLGTTDEGEMPPFIPMSRRP